MSLEVDRRNYLPTVYPEHDESKSLALHPENRQVAYESQAFEEKSQGRRWCGLRPATLLLSIALAIATALAVIAAGVGGSLAAKNKSPAASVPAQASNSSCATCNTTSPVNMATCQPTDNCANMGPSYSTLDGKQIKFTLLCKTNLGGSDITGVYVNSLADCIQACANFGNFVQPTTESCHSVTFDIDHNPKSNGNCFLKYGTTIPQSDCQSCSSAYIATSGG